MNAMCAAKQKLCETESGFMRHSGMQDGRKIYRKSRNVFVVKAVVSTILALRRIIQYSCMFHKVNILQQNLYLASTHTTRILNVYNFSSY